MLSDKKILFYPYIYKKLIFENMDKFINVFAGQIRYFLLFFAQNMVFFMPTYRGIFY